MRIAVIGAGVVGLASAWWLARDGHAVTVVDAAAGVGLGTSFANGAQLSYSYVAPMASASVLASLPHYLFGRGSPVRFVPSADPAQWRWIIRFLRACTGGTAALNTARLLALSFHSRDALAEMMRTETLAFDHRRNGKLVVQSSPAAMAAAAAQLRLQAALGCEQYALTAAECLALEPGLESIRGRLVGGIHTPSEAVGDCRKLCEELHRVLSPGVAFRFGTPISRLRVAAGRVAGLETAGGAIEADAYVLAAGIGSSALGRAAGVPVPILPIRGYSITARVKNGNLSPTRSITDMARKTVYAPLGDSVRVAGFAEIGGGGAVPPPSRIATLVRGLAEIFPGACALDEVHPWLGFRPSTPTDVPVIGRSGLDNLWLNLGHGSLGFTLSAGSGRLLADLVAGRMPAIAAADYAPAV